MGLLPARTATTGVKLLRFILRLVVRAGLLALGYYYLPQLVHGLQLDNHQTLWILSLGVCVLDAILRPLIRLMALPADLMTLGTFSRLLYPLAVLVVLISLPFWFPGVVALGTTVPQHVQAALAYWVFTLTVLVVTR